jgi:hypothetical protein
MVTLYYATFSWVPPLGVPLQNDNMKAHIYFYQIIQFWNYTIITYCSYIFLSRPFSHVINHKNISSILKFWKLIHVIPTILKRSCLVLSYFEQDIKKCILLVEEHNIYLFQLSYILYYIIIQSHHYITS